MTSEVSRKDSETESNRSDLNRVCINRNELTFLAGQVGHVGDSLHGFAEARFVCQNSIEAFLAQVDEPVHADLLVVSQGATQ